MSLQEDGREIGRARGKRLVAFGESRTLREWTEDPRCVVGLRTACNRLSKGWGLEEALTTPAKQLGGHRAPIPLTAFGETKTRREWSQDDRCAVSLEVLTSRLIAGWAAEEAIVTPPTKKVNLLFEAFGETKTLKTWSSDPRCEVTYETLLDRADLGWTMEKALATVAANRRRATHVAFGESRTLREWVRDPRCRVAYSNLRGRLAKGWTLEEAIATPPRSSGGPPQSPRSGRTRAAEDAAVEDQVERFAQERGLDLPTAMRLIVEAGIAALSAVSVSEAARMLGISRHAAHELYQRGRIEGSKAGRTIQLRRDSVEAYGRERAAAGGGDRTGAEG